VVSRIYGRIGVRTDWVGVVRFDEQGKVLSRDETPRPLAQLILNIVTMKMAGRQKVRDDVLGYAAVSNEGMGRIAYVIRDRVRDAAAKAPMNEGDLLGFVMAHEVGHLLLPHGSESQPHEAHTPTDLMRGRWDVRDFWRLDVRKLGFSARQASQIRSTIEHESAAIAAAATEASPDRGRPGLTASPDRGSDVARMRWSGMR
jgi:hypothetical protein